jgi:aminoglycoside/choline kinase family phosphotransferase
MWELPIEIFHDPTPAGPAVFIHRDYHLGNMLWTLGKS